MRIIIAYIFSSRDMDREDSDPVELQDFPLLRQCLQEVDPELGFDIEVKYPLDLKVSITFNMKHWF